VTQYNTPRQHEIWLVLQRNELPQEIWSNTQALWRSFDARASIEASIKVSKQECSWTMPQTLSAKAADTWTQMSEIAFWHLFLVRKEAALTRFGWQKADRSGLRNTAIWQPSCPLDAVSTSYFSGV
jgi:hypothetical protein